MNCFITNSKSTVINTQIERLPEKANELFVNFKDVQNGYDGQNRLFIMTADGRHLAKCGKPQ
jgi:hypothetical protein